MKTYLRAAWADFRWYLAQPEAWLELVIRAVVYTVLIVAANLLDLYRPFDNAFWLNALVFALIVATIGAFVVRLVYALFIPAQYRPLPGNHRRDFIHGLE